MNREELIDHLESRMKDNANSLCFARLADLYLDKERHAEAIQLCVQGIKNHPSYVTGYFILGKAYLASGEDENAEQTLKQVLTHDRDYLTAHLLLGDLMQKMGWENKAAVHYRDILSIDPSDEVAKQRLASLNEATTWDFKSMSEEVPESELAVLAQGLEEGPESDDDWVNQIREVFPDEAPSMTPEPIEKISEPVSDQQLADIVTEDSELSTEEQSTDFETLELETLPDDSEDLTSGVELDQLPQEPPVEIIEAEPDTKKDEREEATERTESDIPTGEYDAEPVEAETESEPSGSEPETDVLASELETKQTEPETDTGRVEYDTLVVESAPEESGTDSELQSLESESDDWIESEITEFENPQISEKPGFFNITDTENDSGEAEPLTPETFGPEEEKITAEFLGTDLTPEDLITPDTTSPEQDEQLDEVKDVAETESDAIFTETDLFEPSEPEDRSDNDLANTELVTEQDFRNALESLEQMELETESESDLPSMEELAKAFAEEDQTDDHLTPSDTQETSKDVEELQNTLIAEPDNLEVPAEDVLSESLSEDSANQVPEAEFDAEQVAPISEPEIQDIDDTSETEVPEIPVELSEETKESEAIASSDDAEKTVIEVEEPPVADESNEFDISFDTMISPAEVEPTEQAPPVEVEPTEQAPQAEELPQNEVSGSLIDPLVPETDDTYDTPGKGLDAPPETQEKSAEAHEALAIDPVSPEPSSESDPTEQKVQEEQKEIPETPEPESKETERKGADVLEPEIPEPEPKEAETLESVAPETEVTEPEPAKRIVTPTLAEIYVAQGQYDKAIEIYEELLEEKPDRTEYTEKIAALRKKMEEENQ